MSLLLVLASPRLLHNLCVLLLCDSIFVSFHIWSIVNLILMLHVRLSLPCLYSFLGAGSNQFYFGVLLLSQLQPKLAPLLAWNCILYYQLSYLSLLLFVCMIYTIPKYILSIYVTIISVICIYSGRWCKFHELVQHATFSLCNYIALVQVDKL